MFHQPKNVVIAVRWNKTVNSLTGKPDAELYWVPVAPPPPPIRVRSLYLFSFGIHQHLLI